MILNNINIFFQNVQKNNLLTNIILEAQKEFNIIFIQELLWNFICSISSPSNKEGEKLVGVPNHLNWTTFSRNPSNYHDSPRVTTYISTQFTNLHFALHKDIFNHRDIFCISFFNYSSIYFLLNIYSDSLQLALKYLKNTEVNINNVLIMTGDFNIRDSLQDLSFSYHSIHRNTLTDIADSFQLDISNSIVQALMRYIDNQDNSDSVIDLMFLKLILEEFNNHSILPDQRLFLDHTLLMVKISIFEEDIQNRKCTIVKNSKEEHNFVIDIMNLIKDLNTNHINSKDDLEVIIQDFAKNTNNIWFKCSKLVNITKCSNLW